jgi:hypothetical protein
MAHSRKYWFIVFLIPCIVGLDQCGTTLFLTGQKSSKSPTEPCLEQLQTPTPIQVIVATPSPNKPGPQRTPIIQDGDVVIGPEILPTPVPPPPNEYTIYAAPVNVSGCIYGILTISPSGTFAASPGNLTFTLTFIDLGGGCASVSVEIDGVWVSTIPWGMAPTTYSMTVTGNHSVIFYY